MLGESECSLRIHVTMLAAHLVTVVARPFGIIYDNPFFCILFFRMIMIYIFHPSPLPIAQEEASGVPF